MENSVLTKELFEMLEAAADKQATKLFEAYMYVRQQNNRWHSHYDVSEQNRPSVCCTLFHQGYKENW